MTLEHFAADLRSRLEPFGIEVGIDDLEDGTIRVCAGMSARGRVYRASPVEVDLSEPNCSFYAALALSDLQEQFSVDVPCVVGG